MRITSMKTSDLDDAVKALIMGLTTDGAHHKQYYLEQALLALTEESWLENARTEFQWEKGIPS